MERRDRGAGPALEWDSPMASTICSAAEIRASFLGGSDLGFEELVGFDLEGQSVGQFRRKDTQGQEFRGCVMGDSGGKPSAVSWWECVGVVHWRQGLTRPWGAMDAGQRGLFCTLSWMWATLEGF